MQLAALRAAATMAVQQGSVSAESARQRQAGAKARRRAVQAELHEAQGGLSHHGS